MAGLEYNPLQMSVNTEVKVPLVSVDCDNTVNGENEGWLNHSCNNDDIYGDGQRVETEVHDSCSASFFSVDELDLQNYAEYISILKLYRELPRDMCVVEIMSKFGSSESDLGRNNYFNHLKSTCSNFPYSPDVELKRRMSTRTGDPVALRLAQYIYSIVEVTDGGDPVLIKGMISTGRGLQRRYVVCGGRDRHRNYSTKTKFVDKFNCSAEVKLL